MPTRAPFRVLLAAAALSTACLAQSASPPSAPQPATPPSPAQQFPFPGEAPPPPAAPNPNAPTSNAPNAPTPSAASEHPFPTSNTPDMPGEAPDSSSSGSSSSRSSSSSSDTPDTPVPTSTRKKLPKVKDLQTPDERVDEDLRVAKFYYNRENFLGAYMRSKDAVKTEPDYAPTHFSLAQAAEKMKKLEEAKAEYNAYLKLAPEGDYSKEARKALAALP